MTRNEHIASIMLEAADLLREDNEDVLDETSLNPYDCLCALYEQACNMSLNEDASDSLYLILETVNEMPKNDKEIKEAIIKGDTNAITKAVNAVAKWYYKVDPDKKFKGLHAVLKFFNSVIYQICSKSGGGLVNRAIYNTTDKSRNKTIALALLTSNLIINTTNFVKNPSITGAGVIAATTALDSAFMASSGIYAKGQYEYNIKNFDKNLKTLKDGRKKLVNMNNPRLRKVIYNYDMAINTLNKEKAKYEKLKASKISARGAAIRAVEAEESK